jgi:photosystem II stability/assembly factor-like uncharacterized protein
VTGTWERVSTREGGTVSGLAWAAAADGSTVVFAATPIGVFRSADFGTTWRPLHGAGGSVVTVAGVEVVAPSPRYAQDGTLFVGALNGVFRWRESGGIWEHLLSDTSVLGLVCLAGQDDALTLLAGAEQDGILLSRDGGRTWTGANPGLLDLTVMALAAPADFEQRGLAFAATTSGLYRTRNGAESWRGVDLDWDDPTIQCLALSPDFAVDRLVLAGTEEVGLLVSDDAGRRWQDVPALAECSVNSIAFGASGQVATATDQGIALSADGGRSWRIVGEEPGSAASVCIVPAGDTALILAGLPFGGVVRSADGGATWEPSNTGLYTSLVAGLSLSPAFAADQTIYTTSAHTGIDASHDGGQTWTTHNDGLKRANVYGLASVPEASGPARTFAATDAGLFGRRDSSEPWHDLLPDLRWQPTMAVAAVANGASATIFTALYSTRVLRSDDGGATWQSLGLPFGGGYVVGLAVSPEYVTDHTIYAALSSKQLHAGVGDIVVWRSIDGGERWERWLEERGAAPVQLVALPANSRGESIVVGLGGRILRPRADAREVRGGVRRPLWASRELPSQARGSPPAITGLVASPAYAQDRTLFVASSAGAYVSRDGGESFSAWSEELEPLALVAVALSPAYAEDRLVYALGLGGTLWRRRDG